MKKYISVLAFSILFSCSIFWVPDKHTLVRKDNFSEKLRTDGYYSDGNFFILYKNGVLIFNQSHFNTLIEIDNVLKDKMYFSLIQKRRDYWGLYEINGTEIKLEYGMYVDANAPLQIYQSIGKVLNDTTFELIKEKDVNDKEFKNYDAPRIYRFRKFSPKPDSTNNFIK